MRALLDPKHWSITTRLVLIAAVPAAIMFVAISLTLYFSAAREVRAEVQDRGRMLSAALAHSTRYGIVSGNAANLSRSLEGLLAQDRSIVAIEIQDRERRPLVRVGAQVTGGGLVTLVTPVRTDVLDIDLFDNTAGARDARTLVGNVAGHVSVTMSPEPILEVKRRRVYTGAGLILAMAVLSMLTGLFLAQRLRSPLCAVLQALRQIRQGEYDIRLDTDAQGELGLLQNSIVDMAKGLSIKRQELEELVANRTAELQVAVSAIGEADAEKRRLIAHANDTMEEERKRISGEIHDTVNATLAAVRLLASSIEAKARADGSDENARLARRILDVTKETYDAMRNIIKKLRPEVLDALGLKGALEGMVRSFDQADPKCEFIFTADRDFPVVRGQVGIAAYRAVQEGLSNVVKHAEASRVWVSLEHGPEDHSLRIMVKDNGKGFDSSSRAGSGLGLIGMRERMSAVGGRMELESKVGKGTTLTLLMRAG